MAMKVPQHGYEGMSLPHAPLMTTLVPSTPATLVATAPNDATPNLMSIRRADIDLFSLLVPSLPMVSRQEIDAPKVGEREAQLFCIVSSHTIPPK